MVQMSPPSFSCAWRTLRVERLAKGSPGCGDITHNNHNGDGKGGVGGYNGSRAIHAAPPQIAGESRAAGKKLEMQEKSRGGRGGGGGCAD